MTSKWYRENKGRITGDWVDLNCKWLTQRDIKVLQLIDKFGMLTAKQLVILHSDFSRLSNPLHSINRRLRKMWEYYILEKAFFARGYGEGSSPAVYAIGRAGAIVLSKSMYYMFTYTENRIPVLPVQTKHRLGVNSIACELAKVGLLSGWESDYAVRGIRADGFVDLPLFLEYDTGNEDRGARTKFPTVLKKFKRYKQLYASGWNHKGIFPSVIFVTESNSSRVSELRKKILGWPIQILIVHTDNLPILLSRIRAIKVSSQVLLE